MMNGINMQGGRKGMVEYWNNIWDILGKWNCGMMLEACITKWKSGMVV